jgi:hypothetical protein
VAEKDKDEAEKIARGEVPEPELFYFHREAGTHNPDTGIKYDLDRFEDRVEAIREASGPSVAKWSDLRGIAKQWDRPGVDLSYLERVWLNRWTQAAAQAYDVKAWADHAAVGASIADGSEISLGFDGSRWKDTTALVATEMATGLQVPLGLWVPDDDNPVDPIEVTATCDDVFSRFKVVRMYGDPAQGWDEQLADLASRYGPKVVLFFYNDSRNLRNTAYMCRSYQKAIFTGEVHGNGDEDMTKHLGHAQKHEIKMVDEEGKPLWVVRKERHDSEKKIDLAMAGGMSHQARLDAFKSGWQPQPPPQRRRVVVS